jgi:nicotinate phosphoribosyltransferase
MAFEIFVLAIVNELYFRRFDAQVAQVEGRRRLAAKVEQLREFGREPPRRHPFEMFDFGLRRRFSFAWQREVVNCFKRELPQFFKGTSNVLLAKELGLVPIAPWRTSTCRASRHSVCGCATSRRPRSKAGCRSTAATSAPR